MDSEAATETAGCSIGCLFSIAYSALVLIGGFGWISDHYGGIAAFLSILVLLTLRIQLPLMIGSVFFLIDEYSLNGFLAFIVVFLPGLPFILPAGLLGMLRNKE